MKWSIREPDVQEFSAILRRHGAWNDDLTAFASVAKSIDIDALVEETTAAVVDAATTAPLGAEPTRRTRARQADVESTPV
jgi:hypothetical protein